MEHFPLGSSPTPPSTWNRHWQKLTKWIFSHVAAHVTHYGFTLHAMNSSQGENVCEGQGESLADVLPSGLSIEAVYVHHTISINH